MSSIRLLSDQLINRIAAGEVVERPASVLKELIENSLDAGAARIEVDTEAGGRRLIVVSDNGQGMTSDDLLLAIERHATSKITEDTDLLSINTLGFRGEALPSIGSVSRMTITSAAESDGHGSRVRVSGGKLLGVEEASRDRGTTIEVQDLFFNVPARRKFLKTVQTESAHLTEMAHRYALGQPGLRLIYRHNSQELVSTSPSEDALARVARVLGRETARNMFEFEGGRGEITVSGFLGRPQVNRSRANGLYLYVNGRPVMDRLLTRAVMDAYHGRLMTGRYPYAVIFLTIPSESVDVNVHPAKAQVRFRQPNQVLNSTAEILRQALGETMESQSPQTGTAGYSQPRPAFEYRPSDRVSQGPLLMETAPWRESRSEEKWEPVPPVSPPPMRPVTGIKGSGLRVIGQLFKTYILAQGPDGLYIVDQHAAHERILFDRLEGELEVGSLGSQALLLPATLELTPLKAVGLEKALPSLNRFGFELAPFGGSTFVLKSLPAVLTGRDPEKVMSEIIDELDSASPESGLQRIEESLLQSLACHGSVRAGDELTFEEMDRLLGDLDETKISSHCPHGRPFIFQLSLQELEKIFKRI
ncbi:MAG: DNA mismatch repair endonuclease MutL [Deltaproteobacteria bacterium]|nr:DNA mismatch repair endonuclease MutL [Deltaproteobacteria bacterium]